MILPTVVALVAMLLFITIATISVTSTTNYYIQRSTTPPACPSAFTTVTLTENCKISIG